MLKMKRNFFMALSLFTLLLVNLITLGGGDPRTSFGSELRGHLHAISGIGLMLVALVHIILHISWFRAVINGKAKGRPKLFMYGMVSIFILLAFISGLVADGFIRVGRFHAFTGTITLLGMVIHSLKHTRWMVFAGKKILAGEKGKASSTTI